MPSEIKRALLGRLAIHAGLVTQQQVIECLNEQQEQFRAKKKVPRLGEILYKKGYLTKEQVRALLLYRKSMTAPSPPSEKTISVIGDYEILERLGADATGTSYRARNQKTEDIVSLKVMSQEIMASAGFRERFVKESKRGASLNHPNIRRLITVGCKDNRYFYTSEYVEGPSLKQILDEKNKLSVEEAGRITRELADALHHGHEKGIIHGDVRPSNILLTADGSVKLMEFGVLKDSLRNLMRLMGTADTVGFYIAPEQAVGDRVISGGADVYSLGAVYYHMLVGKPPFEGGSPLQSLIRLCEERFTPPHEADGSIPREISDIVVKMVHAEPSERYGSMAEVKDDLDAGGINGAPSMMPEIEHGGDSLEEFGEEYVSDSGEGTAVDMKPVVVPDIEDDDSPGQFGEEYVSESAEPATAPAELPEEKAPEAEAGKMPARRELRRSHRMYSVQPAAGRWGIPIVVGSLLVVGAVVLGVVLLSSEPEGKGSVSAPAAAEVTEKEASQEEESAETEAGADEEEREEKVAEVGEAAEEEDQEEEAEEKKAKRKAKPKVVKEEDAAFGKGGSLFAPVGWKAPKGTEEDEEEEEE